MAPPRCGSGAHPLYQARPRTRFEITDLLSLNDRDCDEARAIAEHKQHIIQQRIDDLSAMQHELTKLIKACKKNVSGHERCAIIAALVKASRVDDQR